MSTIYEDEDVLINENELKIKNYYFPIPFSKTIPFSEILEIEFRRLNWFLRRNLQWGICPQKMSYWFSLDYDRIFKQKYIAIHTRSFIKPTFTPENPEYV